MTELVLVTVVVGRPAFGAAVAHASGSDDKLGPVPHVHYNAMALPLVAGL